MKRTDGNILLNDEEKKQWMCEKCSLAEHEWLFCRCEGRNIKLAKYLRSVGMSPWDLRRKEEKGK